MNFNPFNFQANQKEITKLKDKSYALKMVQFMMDTQSIIIVKARVHSYGLMVQSIKENGNKTWLGDKANLHMEMEIIIKELG